jgi:hypothetical protein
MFKKNLLLTIALALMASFSLPYVARNYSGSQGNPATFETLEETRTSSPAAVASLETNNGKDFKSQISLSLGYNGTKKIDTFDSNTYPVAGFKADPIENIKLNNEYKNTSWYINNADGVPMIALSVTEGLVHALYPEYGKIMWNFAKHYSRDQKTGAIKYKPYSK